MEIPHLADPAALGEWLGTVSFIILTTLGGLIARKYSEAIKDFLRPRPRRRRDPRDEESGPVERIERPSAERRRQQLREQVHSELFAALDTVKHDLDLLEEKVNSNAELLGEHLQQVQTHLERVRVLEVEGEHMRESIREIKDSAIRDRQEFLSAIATARAAVDNLAQITVRQLGQRVGDPLGVPRGGGNLS